MALHPSFCVCGSQGARCLPIGGKTERPLSYPSVDAPSEFRSTWGLHCLHARLRKWVQPGVTLPQLSPRDHALSGAECVL